LDYKKRYGLKQAPFRLSPDPDFFFPSETHRDALETLLYSIRSGEGFIQITGQPGTGKSMLLRKILREIGDSVVVGLILHSNIQARDLIPIIMQDLKIDISGVNLPSRGNLIPLFRDFLLAQAEAGNQVIIIVDEAQNLPDETLEELRMLSNLETEKTKLLQIILVGQLELEERISPDRLRQLSQRITIRYRLKPLTLVETRSYIFHRLEIAAINRDTIQISFQPGVLGSIHKYSGGIPRLINIVCERSLMAAYIQGSSRISSYHLKKAILSIDGEPAKEPGFLSFRPTTWVLFAVFLLMAGLWGYLRTNPDLPLVSKAFSFLKPAIIDFNPRTITDFKTETETYKIPRLPEKDPVHGVREAQASPAPKALSQPSPKPEPEPEPEKNTLSSAARWMTLPQGVEQVGLINIEKGTLAMVKKKDGELFCSKEIQVNWPYPQGIYMAGYSRQKKPFIFHPEIAYLKKIELDNPEFWQMIRTGERTRITPLIALNSENMLEKDLTPEAHQEINLVHRVVLDWADTWRSMNFEKLMEYFSNVTSVHDLEMDHPLVFSKTRMESIKKEILQQSSFIRLNLSEPICLINPLDPNLAYAVFHQTYQSKTYQDRGTNVLYFRRLDNDSARPDWKITGKLWILDPDMTIGQITP